MKLSLAVVVLASTIQFLVLPMEVHGTTSEQLGKEVQQIQEHTKSETENAKSAYYSAPWELLQYKVNSAQYPHKFISETANTKSAFYGAPREMFRPEASNAKSAKYPPAQGFNSNTQPYQSYPQKEMEFTAQISEVEIETEPLIKESQTKIESSTSVLDLSVYCGKGNIAINSGIGQTFYPTVTGVIDRISIWMAPYASPTAGYYVQVFKGKPGSVLLGKSPTIYPNAGIRTPQQYYDFQFSSASITLNAGSMYSWKLVPTSYGGSFNKCPNSIPGNGYWLGKYSFPKDDYPFRLYIFTSTVPTTEPPTTVTTSITTTEPATTESITTTTPITTESPKPVLDLSVNCGQQNRASNFGNGQTFYPTVTGVIDRISIWMAPIPSSPTGFYVQVFKGIPGSVLLGRSPTFYPNAGIQKPPQYYDFNFSSASITVDAGSMYSWKLVLTRYRFQVQYKYSVCPNSIPGNAYRLGKYSYPNDDYSFRLYIFTSTATPTTEPPTTVTTIITTTEPVTTESITTTTPITTESPKPVLDLSVNCGQGNIAINSGIGQTFYPTVTGVIDRISIWMAPYASPTAGYYVQVFKGKPGSVLLGKSPTIYPNRAIGTPQRYYDFQFSSPSITLNAGSMYSWKLVPTSYGGSFNKCPNSIPGNGYWLGKYSFPNDDYPFRLYIFASTVPTTEPPTTVTTSIATTEPATTESITTTVPITTESPKPVLDLSVNCGQGNIAINSGIGQTFYPTVTGVIDRISIWMAPYASPTAGYYVQVFKGKPGSVLLGQSPTIYPNAGIWTPQQYYDFQFSSASITLNAGSMYSWKLVPTSYGGSFNKCPNSIPGNGYWLGIYSFPKDDYPFRLYIFTSTSV